MTFTLAGLKRFIVNDDTTCHVDSLILSSSMFLIFSDLRFGGDSFGPDDAHLSRSEMDSNFKFYTTQV